MYTTEVYQINKNHKLYSYCKNYCEKAKLFRNAVVYRYRQLMFASWKNFKDLDPQQIEVIAEFSRGNSKFKPVGEKNYMPSYNQMDYVMRVNQNPNYFSGLPKQSVQQIERKVLQDFKNWMAAVKKYNKCPSGFTGKPKLPGYTKGEQASFTITNQDAVIYQSESKFVLKLPLTKKRLALLDNRISCKLKQVEIKPYYDIYKICVVYETEGFTDKILNRNRILALDLGINNFLTSSNNCGLSPFIINGKVMKSKNAYVMKESARLQSELMKSQGLYTSRKLQRLWRKRHNYFKDFTAKITSYLVRYCFKNNIGTVVVGKNREWKQESDIDETNNKMTSLISYTEILHKVKEKLERHGIQYIEIDESYTSKASFLDNDKIPSNGDKDIPEFSGYRKYRGLYISRDGIGINADVNAASNILKKEFPEAFCSMKDFSYLYKSVEVVNIV